MTVSFWANSGWSFEIGKEEDAMILCTENPKNSTKKINKWIYLLLNSINQVTGYKINIKKSIAFLYTNNEVAER